MRQEVPIVHQVLSSQVTAVPPVSAPLTNTADLLTLVLGLAEVVEDPDVKQQLPAHAATLLTKKD